MIILSILAFIGTAMLLIGVLYLYFLAVVGILVREKKRQCPRDFDFLILVPAHNESRGIIPTLESLSKVEKTGKLRIVVIADNCTDNTAQVATNHGVEVLERNDLSGKGKGYALEWALTQFHLQDYNAVAILDADTITERNMLQVMASSLTEGAEAVQLNNITSAKRGKPLTYLQYMANLTENHFFYKPRHTLRLPILLRGTGMAIRSEILNKYPWDSHSVTEDADYAIRILRCGYRIAYTTLSTVYSASPASFDQTFMQKTRWATGTIALIVDNFLPLITTGIHKRNFRLVELAFSLLLLSRPTLIYFTIGVLVLSFLCPGQYQQELVIVNIALLFIQIAYLFSGVIYGEDKKQAFTAMLISPVYGIWYMFVQLRALLSFRKAKWVRTKRDDNA